MISRFAVRTFASVLAITFAAGVQALHGQAAPQLLPYQTSVVAGGGTTALIAGAACPVSGKTSLDAYGDGCLATEVQLNAPKYVTEDAAGNVYFSDYSNLLIRRVDAVTGVITAVAGGGTLALPSAAGTACPSNGSVTATDFQGDGCLATDVKLVKPTGVAVSPLTGDLVFADAGTYTVRGISSKTGAIYNVAGSVSAAKATYGYIANTASATFNAATASALDAPYGLHFDAVGNLYIAEEYKDAILVVNTSAATTTVANVSIPAGTIAKIAGFKSATYGAYCPNGTTGTTGCGYGSWVTGSSANSSLNDAPYDVTSDASGNVYFANEYAAAIGQITSAGILNTYAGTQASAAITNQRGAATSFPFGTPFGIASDSYGNIYIPDSVTGWIWRVDAVGGNMYVLAGAGPVCASSKDAYGDGCPAGQTKFPNGTLKPAAPATPTYASTPGLSGLFVDASGTLLIGDTVANLVHKMTTNTNFGTIAPNDPTQNIEIHFGAGDAAASYNLTTNSSFFTLGTATCTYNTGDTTTDCVLPVTANPPASAAGAAGFSSNLRVTSNLGKVGNFTLSGVLSLTLAPSNTVLTLSASSTNPVTPITLTATVGPSSSISTGDTVTFFSNGVPIGTPQTLVNGSASMQYTFPVGTYSLTAQYSGGYYLEDSTSTATTLTSVIPVFNITPTTPSMTVAQGQYGIDSFSITTIGSYTGTVNFACSGLPANTSCSFSPTSLAVGGTGVNSNTVSLNIITGASTTAALAKPAIPGTGSSYRMLLACLLPGAAGIVLLGFGRNKRTRLSASLLLMGMLVVVAGFSGCAGNPPKATPTPAGTYTVTVTATGTPNVVSTSTNIVQTSSLTLTVTGR